MSRQDPGAATGAGVYPVEPDCECGCTAYVHAWRPATGKRAGCSNSGCECSRYAAGEAK